MAPMVPHITAELYERRTGGDVHRLSWPVADEAKAAVDTVTMVIQVNGKVRDKVEVDAAISEKAAVDLALSRDKVVGQLGGAAPKRTISRPPKLVNIVV
jgi:leucyl-tRNA synthetase